jgi:hypothetical protein
MKCHNVIGHAWPPRRPPTMIQGGRQVTRAGEAANRGSVLPRRAHCHARVSTMSPMSTMPTMPTMPFQQSRPPPPSFCKGRRIGLSPPRSTTPPPPFLCKCDPRPDGHGAHSYRSHTHPPSHSLPACWPSYLICTRTALGTTQGRGMPRMRILGAAGANHAHPSHALTWPLFTASFPFSLTKTV